MSFVLDDRNSTRSQSVFKILADLNPGQVNRSAYRILITAPSGLKKNKSAIALNLTFAAGLQGHRVLLIDADLTERHLTRVFIEPASFGLMEVLGGIADPVDVIVNDPNLPVAFFPCAPLRKSASLTISGQALSSCLDKLSDEYDLILINGGKLGAEGYITQLATASDQLVLVTDSASVKSGGHRQAIQAAQPFADKFAGTIVLPDDAP